MKLKIDGHTHLENGPLTKEYVWEFVNAAKEKGLDHLQILDHTHRFYEFAPMYEGVRKADPRQDTWFQKKQVNSIHDYLTLVEEMKKEDFPIDVTFGLEVCYMPEYEDFLREVLKKLPDFDFLVGSVHSMGGKLYDMDGWSKEILWDVEPAEKIYKDYFNNLKKAIRSGLFTQIGHPDVIKMYGYNPGYDLQTEYDELARLAKEYNVKMEDNTGAHYRYHHPDVGLAPTFRKTLMDNGVSIISASDGHYPKHVAMDFELLEKEYQ